LAYRRATERGWHGRTDAAERQWRRSERDTTKLTQGDEAMTQGNGEFQKMLDTKPISDDAWGT
jgi:hypothetical protein